MPDKNAYIDKKIFRKDFPLSGQAKLLYLLLSNLNNTDFYIIMDYATLAMWLNTTVHKVYSYIRELERVMGLHRFRMTIGETKYLALYFDKDVPQELDPSKINKTIIERFIKVIAKDIENDI